MNKIILSCYGLLLVCAIGTWHAYQASSTVKSHYYASAIAWSQTNSERIHWYFQWDQQCFQTEHFYEWFIRMNHREQCIQESGAPGPLRDSFLLTLQQSMHDANTTELWKHFPWENIEEMAEATSLPLQTIGKHVLLTYQFLIDKNTALMQTFREVIVTPAPLAP